MLLAESALLGASDMSSWKREVAFCRFEALIIRNRYQSSCTFSSLSIQSKTQTQVDDGKLVLLVVIVVVVGERGVAMDTRHGL